MFVLSQSFKMPCRLFSSSENLPSCSEANPGLAGWRRDYMKCKEASGSHPRPISPQSTCSSQRMHERGQKTSGWLNPSDLQNRKLSKWLL